RLSVCAVHLHDGGVWGGGWPGPPPPPAPGPRRGGGAHAPEPERDLTRQKKVLDAFLAASRAGDFEALLAVLDPDVVLRADSGPHVGGAAASKLVRGAAAVARQALTFARFAASSQPVLVNGEVGVIALVDGRPLSVMGITVVDGRIVALHILADPDRLARLGVAGPGE
ncbi:nuclear transport factor 2 family protein, partial [Streptomyces sp. NPDC060188]|uniref:nuclear transport factor 2 family protein n=1 Tax=Streptomyces sp. NPDC060188 TaxID=3347068 RepID=UPI003669518A